jgi:hypothetical protein
MSGKLQLNVLRLGVIVAIVGLALRVTTVALASSFDQGAGNSDAIIVQATSSPDEKPPIGDAWTILAPFETLGSFFIRICIGLVGLSVAIGTYKNATVANVAHTLSMSNPAASALFNIGIGVGYFLVFWILPGVIQYIYGQIVTPEAMNNMTNLKWLHDVGNTTPTVAP